MQVNYEAYQISITFTEFLWKSLFHGCKSVHEEYIGCIFVFVIWVPKFQKTNSDHLGKRKIRHAISVNFETKFVQKLNGEHCEKMTIKTVVIYIPMPNYNTSNCCANFYLNWRIINFGSKFAQKLVRRSIQKTQPKNYWFLVKNMYFDWYR